MSRNTAGARPPAASGCFKAASSGTGANSLAARSSTRRRNTPGGVRFNGRPAESSIAMPQRANSAETWRASARSGVTRAAVAPGVSSLRRSSSAIVSASSCTPAQSWRWSPVNASGGAGESARQASVVAAGRIASPISCSRRARGAAASRNAGALSGQLRMSAGVSSNSRSRFASRYCGWASSYSIAAHSALSQRRSRPARITAPLSRPATTRISSVIAGTPPVRPAAMTGSHGGLRRHCSAWRASRRLRRSPGSIAPSAARMAGQAFGRISSNLHTTSQCAERSAGARSRSRAKLAPSVATVSSRRARLVASAAAWPGSSRSRRPISAHFITSRVSSNWRRNGGIAGGMVRSSPSAMPSTNQSSSESRSPIGRMRGSNSGVPGSLPSGEIRRKASRKARTARRVGNSTMIRDSANGFPPAISAKPSARVAKNGRSGGMV